MRNQRKTNEGPQEKRTPKEIFMKTQRKPDGNPVEHLKETNRKRIERKRNTYCKPKEHLENTKGKFKENPGETYREPSENQRNISGKPLDFVLGKAEEKLR